MQIVEVLGDYDKYPKLIENVQKFNDGSKVLIFAETKKGCDQLTRSLQGQVGTRAKVQPVVHAVFPCVRTI
jgi:superfamily II DNA/RNA helicase